MMEFWPHQLKGLEDSWRLIDEGCKAFCVVTPTGGGKTVMQMEMVKEALARQMKVAIYTPRVILTEQTGLRFDDYGIEFGYRASSIDENPALLRDVQVCSLWTDHKRVYDYEKWDLHDADLVIYDEPQAMKSKTGLQIAKDYRRKGAVWVGFTATPIDLEQLCDALVIAGSNLELRQCGAHVPCDTFGPSDVELHKIKKTNVGTYSVGSVTKVLRVQQLFGNIVQTWDRLNPNRLPTVMFAPGVKESRWLVDQCASPDKWTARIPGSKRLLQQGLLEGMDKIEPIPAAHIDSKSIYYNKVVFGEEHEESSDADGRKRLAELSRKGDVQIVSNRFVLRFGVDWPWLAHGIEATVFGALQSFLQAGGRLLRACEGLERVVWQSHGGSWHLHGSLNQDRFWKLTDTDLSIAAATKKARQQGDDPEPICCPKCRKVRDWRHGNKCPFCGHEHKKSSRMVLQTDGTLKPLVGSVTKRKKPPPSDEQKLWDNCFWGAMNGKQKGGRTFMQVAATYKHRCGRNPPQGLRNMPKAESPQWYLSVAQWQALPEDQK